MRRLLIPTLSAALLVSSSSSPARAEGWKEFKDCISFTNRWCELAKEDANWLEEKAVDVTCLALLAGCAIELF